MEGAMPALSQYLRIPAMMMFLSGCLVGISGLFEPVLSAPESSVPVEQGGSASSPDSSSGSGKARDGKGNHPMRKACAEDVKKLCSEVKAGEGRIFQCLKQHVSDLSQGCADVMQQRAKHRQ
jgi:hypothetical protein